MSDPDRPDPPLRDMTLTEAPVRIGTVALTVHDLDRVAAFYEDAIGLAVLGRDGGRLRLGTAAGPLLELRHDPAARARTPREAGLFHTAFLLPERADLGAWVARAIATRLPLHGASDHGVSEALYLSDPEGNGIEIYADRPRSAWRRSGDGIAMPSDPLDAAALVRAGEGRSWTGFPLAGVIGHMHLQVGAVPAAESFYGGLLGLDITCRYPGGSFFGSGGYHHQIAANSWNSRGAPPRAEPVTGLAEVELRVAAPVLAAVRARAGAAASEPAGTGRLLLRDPWNTCLTLACRSGLSGS